MQKKFDGKFPDGAHLRNVKCRVVVVLPFAVLKELSRQATLSGFDMDRHPGRSAGTPCSAARQAAVPLQSLRCALPDADGRATAADAPQAAQFCSGREAARATHIGAGLIVRNFVRNAAVLL